MSTTRHLLIVAGSLLGAAALHADSGLLAKVDTTPVKDDAAPAKAEAAQAVEPYQLKNRSRFTVTGEGVRAPFWPIGWVHRKGVSSVVASVTALKSGLDAASFRVTSILLGSGSTPSLAVINGRAYSEGEFMKMPRGAAPAAPVPAANGTPAIAVPPRIRVQRIVDGSVVLQRGEEAVTVTMQRPELMQKKAEEPLLDDER